MHKPVNAFLRHRLLARCNPGTSGLAVRNSLRVWAAHGAKLIVPLGTLKSGAATLVASACISGIEGFRYLFCVASNTISFVANGGNAGLFVALPCFTFIQWPTGGNGIWFFRHTLARPTSEMSNFLAKVFTGVSQTRR